ncbi:precorrin-2 C(20)-methyltransferase [Tumidithrix elongata RA019]|uniref:Precorrin-2 C(20)-methyltransferase n=1 Tax=Tumidithrix elongata BACA0141 TaxID=2716417 RepID=A0AAW9Q2U4_9CYAN|nr:precorrin-2 C(20)-methyltransferase [Tumidithrix elongata RA019]
MTPNHQTSNNGNRHDLGQPTLGKFYGIGVGPGDPELLTIKGFRILREVDAIAFPAGRDGKPGMAEAIASKFIQPHQQQIPLSLPVVQDNSVLRVAWQTAVINLVPYLRQGKSLAFIAEGDVSFYSSFTYMMLGLKAKCPDLEIEIVPGISSPLAAAAVVGIPLTIWSDKLAVLPALNSILDLENALDWAEVIVLMKISNTYAQIWEVLRSRDLLNHSHVVAWATLTKQRIWSNLADYPHLVPPYASLLIVSRSESMTGLED